MKRVLIFIFAAISALSCSEREMSGDLKPDVVQYAEHTFEISLPLDDSTATRSVMNADPDRIKDVCAFAFDAGSGDILRYPNGGGRAGDPVMTYVTGSSSVEWSLPLGVEMDIYAVCNMGQITAPSTLSEFLASPDLVYEISDVSDLDGSGVPMTAVLEGIMSDRGSTLVLPARRIVSKYTVRLTDMPYDYEITGIRICNVNSRTTLFARNEAADASSVLIMGDWATEEDLALLNSGEGAEFYMFENAQTTTGSASLEAGSKWYEVHGQLAEKADLCTYLDIISEHEGEARRDRLYLGRDCTSNFDVIRNTIRHISCPAPVSLISGAGQDVLRFAGSCDAFPGETILIPFEYNLLKNYNDMNMVMVSHIYNSKIDEIYPASLSKKTIKELLINKIGFNGVIISDDYDMGAIRKNYTLNEIVVNSISSGVNILLFSNNIKTKDKNLAKKIHKIVKKEIKNGNINPQDIDNSFEKIMAIKALL